MKVFKTKWFNRFAKRADIPDDELIKAIKRAEKGLIDADLGGGLIKQRVAREGQGRSSGYRTIIAYKEKKRAIFLYGFPKNKLGNIEDDELEEWKELGKAHLKASDQDLIRYIKEDRLEEVKYGKNKKV